MLHKGSADSERGPGIWLNPANNRIHFKISTTANWNEGTDSVAALPDGAWSHVAFVKAGNKWRCYINGALDTEFTLAGTTTGNNGSLYVGDDPWYSGCPSTMDDVRVFSGALTIPEVMALYGVVGHWRFDETSGTTASDSTSAGNHGTHVNGPVITTSGIINGAVVFDGSNDYIGVPSSASLVATDALAVSAWVRPVASANTELMIVNKEGEYELALTDTGEIKWALANTSPGWAWHQTGAFVVKDKWSHVLISYDGSEVKTYLNGQLVETYAANGVLGDVYPALNELRIGGRSSNPSGKYFAGAIDDVHVYTRAVTTIEAVNLHGLVGHWKFAEGAGSFSADSTLIANNATLTGGAAWTADCAGNKALLTNGAGGIAATGAAFDPPAEGTLSFWMQYTGGAGTRRICGNGGDWEVRQLADGTIVFDLCADAATNLVSTTVPLAEVGRWYHVAVTYDSATDAFAIYLDGVLHRAGNNSNNMVKQPAAVLSFGTRTGSTEYWPGALRDFRVYNRRLPASEVAEIAGLAGWWKLDETVGTSAADSTGWGRNGTIVGTAAWTAGKVGNALQLNGATYVTVPGLMGSPKNLTLAAWAQLTTADTGGAEVISLGDYFVIRLNQSGQSLAFFYNGTTWVSVPVNQTFAGVGWRHFAAVFDDDNNICRFYINGTEVASLVTTASISYSSLGTNVIFGRHGNGGTTTDFTGKLDDVRVYTRALCPAQIMEIVNDGGGPYQGVKILQWVETR
jgi:hypothetical protein